jgi:hypothetical protein
MKWLGWGLVALICFLLVFVGCNSCNWLGRAGTVIMKELDPAVLLKKYESFKDMSAALDAKLATIDLLENRYKNLLSQYEGTPRKDWARSDKEQVNQWMIEVSGTAASYNSLAREYNSAMSKINYRFCNVGDLPQGAEKPLPREYKPYITSIQ